ncbi:Transmembrane protein fend [Amphibalanus amphitrite]|uniref:Transmembrane protein fend n=1 Tax=Amphibalanus amphitrite TaxID=1232801 RepID=A0A6A4WVQ5_AMPAM|nr:Transmembrane protein fend [Amphibalanus amphitrite]
MPVHAAAMWSSAVLAVCAAGLAAATSATEDRAALSAQCRAMCLDEYDVGKTASHTKCLQNQFCFMCWEKCASLQDVLAAKFTSCDRVPDCRDVGCQLACRFHASPPSAPRLLPLLPVRLDVQFGWSEARWTVTEGGDSQLSRRGSIVYLLLAKTGDQWKELVQTPEASVVLINLPAGTTLRLLAMTRHGQLTAMETVFAPTEPDQLVLDVQDNRLPGDQERQMETYQIEIPGAWLLETVSVARDDNMVLAEVSWQPQTAGLAEYLVTWEVSGGGIKGHLYTDMTSVTLSLWPESIYNIQVELMVSEEGGEPLRSVPLVISTYSVAETGPAGRAVRKVPRSALAGGPAGQRLPLGDAALLALLLLALCCTALCGLLVTARQRCAVPRRPAAGPPAPRLLPAVSRCVAHKTVPSPLDVTAIAAIHPPRRL